MARWAGPLSLLAQFGGQVFNALRFSQYPENPNAIFESFFVHPQALKKKFAGTTHTNVLFLMQCQPAGCSRVRLLITAAPPPRLTLSVLRAGEVSASAVECEQRGSVLSRGRCGGPGVPQQDLHSQWYAPVRVCLREMNLALCCEVSQSLRILPISTPVPPLSLSIHSLPSTHTHAGGSGRGSDGVEGVRRALGAFAVGGHRCAGSATFFSSEQPRHFSFQLWSLERSLSNLPHLRDLL